MSWELVIVDIYSPNLVGCDCNHLNRKNTIFIVRYSLLIVIFGVKLNKERISGNQLPIFKLNVNIP